MTKSMHQIRRILELHGQQVSLRKIARLTGIARNTVREYVRRIADSSHPLPDLLAMDDPSLAAIVFTDMAPTTTEDSRWAELQKGLPTMSRELHKTGVTKWLLWEEYRRDQPDGYGYTQFCLHFRRFLGQKEAVMHLRHLPGEVMMVDFAGDKLRWMDPATGEEHRCDVLVCTLPFSAMTYAEALLSQRQEDFLSGMANALTYFGGVPQSIRCDNLRTAVVRPSRYGPVFTEAVELFAAHYQTTMTATRVAKPRDKASVENAVNKIYLRIYGPLRNEEFHALSALNAAILQQLEGHNNRLFKNRDYSRRELFDQEERALLRPLPHRPYALQHVAMAKVQRNYHVILGEDRHQYSVPFALIGKTLKLVYTAETLEIWDGILRVAVHRRDRRPHMYTTGADHMPPNHQHMHARLGWTPDYFLEKARRIGPFTLAAVGRMLESKTFLEQTYNSCLGVFKLGSRYGNDRLEAACQRAETASRIHFKLLENILQNNLDRQTDSEKNATPTLFTHENVRGAAAFS